MQSYQRVILVRPQAQNLNNINFSCCNCVKVIPRRSLENMFLMSKRKLNIYPKLFEIVKYFIQVKVLLLILF